MTSLRRAVFLDRDGVLNDIVERNGEPASPRSLDRFRLAADIDRVKRLRDAGFLVFIVTNQPDIARGHTTHRLLDQMVDAIRSRIHVDDVRVCPHDDAAGCECRKPKPGMILDLARHWHVDMSRSWMIGDMWRDVDAARAAGVRPVLIRRSYNAAVRVEREAASLGEAVGVVLEEEGER